MGEESQVWARGSEVCGLTVDSSIPIKFYLLTVFLLITAGFSIYSTILNAPFLYDDVVFLKDPKIHITHPLQIWDILKDPDTWRRVGTATFAFNF